MRTVFVNPERCIGCRQCELACAVEHSAGRNEATAFLEEPVPRTRIHVEAGPNGSSFPNRCRHCDPAPCVQVCPTAAITRDRAWDVVAVDESRCIGCAMCAVVCPFDVLTFHPSAEGPAGVAVALKCDGCVDRLQRGAEPACSEVCKVEALVFGELNELVAAGRMRETAAVLAAARTEPSSGPDGDPLAAWRAWEVSALGLRRLAAAAARSGNGRHPHPMDGGRGGTATKAGETKARKTKATGRKATGRKAIGTKEGAR